MTPSCDVFNNSQYHSSSKPSSLQALLRLDIVAPNADFVTTKSKGCYRSFTATLYCKLVSLLQSTAPLRVHFSEIHIKMEWCSLMKLYFKKSFAKCRLFCLSIKVRYTTIWFNVASETDVWPDWSNRQQRKGSRLYHISAETKWPPFSRRYFELDFLEWKRRNFDENVIEVCSQGTNWQYSSIGSDNGLATTRWQAIILTNDG